MSLPDVSAETISLLQERPNPTRKYQAVQDPHRLDSNLHVMNTRDCCGKKDFGDYGVKIG